MALRSVILCRNPLDDPFSHLRAFLQAGNELILLTFSARATSLASGWNRVVISYLSCAQKPMEPEDGGFWHRERLV
jgi:hypothetical protein